MNFKTLLSIAAIAAVTQVTGCAMVQTTANLETPVVANPASGPAVKIVSVTDNRKFVYPHEAGDCVTPSVDSEKSLNDVDLKARAYARQGRCDGGEWANHAMVVVPTGSTVAGGVKDAVVAGIKGAGYRIADNEPEAVPVNISIEKFWLANGLDGWGAQCTYMYQVSISSPNATYDVTRSVKDKIYFGLSATHEKYAKAALVNLTNDVSDRLKSKSLN